MSRRLRRRVGESERAWLTYQRRTANILRVQPPHGRDLLPAITDLADGAGVSTSTVRAVVIEVLYALIREGV